MPNPTPSPRLCRDGGACHHSCKPWECYREKTCAPLSGYDGPWGLMPDPSPDLFEKMRLARIDWEDAQERFLRSRGWTLSSEHPDCRWRWSKTINNHNYSFCRREAIQMEIYVGGEWEYEDA